VCTGNIKSLEGAKKLGAVHDSDERAHMLCVRQLLCELNSMLLGLTASHRCLLSKHVYGARGELGMSIGEISRLGIATSCSAWHDGASH